MKILFTGSQSLSNKLIDDSVDTEFEILFDYDVQTLSFDISGLAININIIYFRCLIFNFFYYNLRKIK